MERINRVYDKSEPELDERTFTVSDPWEAQQPNKERYEVCWQKGSVMTGQPFYQQMHNQFRREEPMCIRAPKGLSGKNLDLSTCSHKKIEKGYAPFLSYIGFSRSEDSIKSGGLVPGCFGTSKGRKALYFSLVLPLDPCSHPKYKPYIHMKNHHDQ